MAKIPANGWVNQGQLTVQVHQQADGITVVDAVSTISQKLDFGQSQRNAARFYEALEKRLGPMLRAQTPVSMETI